MPSGQNPNGDSGEPLTVDSAAPAIEAILFPEKENGGETATSKTETPDPAADDTPAETETPETPETPADDEEEAAPESEESTEGDVTDETPEQPAKVKVKIDGQDHEVTLDEALAGYSRTADYTRKTQKLADDRKAFEAEQTALRAERQQIQAKLAEIEQTFAGVQEPDWDKLLAEDPNSFPLVHATWQRHKEQLAAIHQQRIAYEQQMQADAAKAYQQHLAAEAAKLTAAIPEWSNADVATQDKAKMVAYAHSLGFTNDELAQIADHRATVVLRKAMLYDAAEKAKADAAKKAKPKIDAVKAATPGTPAGKRDVSELTRRRQRLAKTHSVDDAASIIELML